MMGKKKMNIKKEVSVNIVPSVDANTSLLRRKTELSLLLPPLYVWTGRKPEPLIVFNVNVVVLLEGESFLSVRLKMIA